MIRLSSSFEFDACAKVRPVSTVSTSSGSVVETPFTVELGVFPVWDCLSMKINLKFSSSSLFNRSKNVGTGTDEGLSGSCNERKNDQSAKVR